MDCKTVKHDDLHPCASAYLDTFTNWMPNGYSGAIPLDSTEYEYQDDMHVPTIDQSGTATGTHSVTTLQDTSKTWTVDEWKDCYVRITGGTGADRFRKVTSNTADTLTFAALTVAPDNTSTYEIRCLATRITVPKDGVYVVTASASHATPGSDCSIGIRLDVNGVFKTLQFAVQSTITETILNMSRHIKLNSGDYVEMQTYQGSGGELRVFGGNARVYLQLCRVGGC